MPFTKQLAVVVGGRLQGGGWFAVRTGGVAAAVAAGSWQTGYDGDPASHDLTLPSFHFFLLPTGQARGGPYSLLPSHLSFTRPFLILILVLILRYLATFRSFASPRSCAIPVVVAAVVHGKQHHDLRAGLNSTCRVWFFRLLLQGRPFVSKPSGERAGAGSQKRILILIIMLRLRCSVPWCNLFYRQVRHCLSP